MFIYCWLSAAPIEIFPDRQILHLTLPSSGDAVSRRGIICRSGRIEARMHLTRRLILTLAITAALPIFAQSKADPVNKDGSGVAIKGYDPVAYFTQSKAVKGSPAFTHQWMSATWWFANAKDRDEFARNPEKYAPQYGGYCAYGVSKGHTSSIDPEAWNIVEGKLYLTYSKDAQKAWSDAIMKNIGEADRNWPALHK
jgi:YHS domain-containing protein